MSKASELDASEHSHSHPDCVEAARIECVMLVLACVSIEDASEVGKKLFGACLPKLHVETLMV